MADINCPDCGLPLKGAPTPPDVESCSGRRSANGRAACSRRAIVRLRALSARLEIRAHEARALLQRLVKRVNANEMVTVESQLGKCSAECADYLRRTYDPKSILRSEDQAKAREGG